MPAARNRRRLSHPRRLMLLAGVMNSVAFAVAGVAILILYLAGVRAGEQISGPYLHAAAWASVASLLLIFSGVVAFRKLSEPIMELLEKSQASNRLILDNVAEGIITTRRDGTITTVNDAFVAMSGYPRREVVGRKASIVRSDHHDAGFFEAMWDALAQEGRWKGEIWNRRRCGEVFPSLLSISAVRDARGRVSRYLAIYNDISELKANEERIRHTAYHDALTQLPNRLLYQDRLALAMAHARRTGEKLAVLFMDLDRFKGVNDHHGHVVGDALLQKVAEVLRGVQREDDTVARWGGDEFTMLLPGLARPREAAIVAQRVLDAFAEPLAVEGLEIATAPSIGIALFPEDGSCVEELTRNADAALYRAKLSGGNGYRFHTAVVEGEVPGARTPDPSAQRC